MWYALRVRYRSEIVVREALVRLGIDARAPEQTVRVVRNGKKSKETRAVLPCYAFADAKIFDQWDYVRELMPAVVGVMRIGDRYATVTSAELHAMRVLAEVEAEPERFTPGQALRMKRGARAELSVLFKRLEAGKVVIDVEMFGRTFEQRVDEAMVEAA
jgi:transcription antitermination factor NusG